MIILEDIALRRGPKLLLEAANTTLQPGQKIALIGANGSGKSSLFAMLLGDLTPDKGNIRGTGSMRIAHMAQEVEFGEQSARDYVTAGNASVHALLTAVEEAERAADFDTAAHLHHQLEELDGYGAPRQAEQLLLGLGFAAHQVSDPITQFSGGWRIRLNLAQALMTPSDLLLLDEPTNHLDLDATLWLESWLQRYRGTLVMISHDRDFIDATCERVMKIEQQQLGLYKGGYSDYERQRAEHLSQQQATFDKQQRRVKEIESFVRRFRYKATKARQAQSRIKELERMQELAPAHIDSPFEFQFPAPGKSSDPLLVLDEAQLGYSTTTILPSVSLTLRPGDRIGLLGKNGAGKTTLLKSLTGATPLLSGSRQSGTHLRVGYFDQQQLSVLDLNASPLLHLQRLTPGRREQQLLNFLGGFNFRGDMATGEIRPFSGGEKARLALAMVVWQDPNVLILDEPTNHLDLEMRHALEVALQGFEGALLLVSHDRHLMRNSVEQLMLVHNGAVQEYDDDLNAYEKWVLSKSAYAPTSEPIKSGSGGSKKQQRQVAAQQRAKLLPLKKALEKIEKQIEQAHSQLAVIQKQLADSDLYAEDQKNRLADLLMQESDAKRGLQGLEEAWIEQQERIEAWGVE